LAPSQRKSPRTGASAPAAAMDHAALVATVKSMQREDPGAKDQWHIICDEQGGHVRDPARHEADFLQAFITEYKSGALSGQALKAAVPSAPAAPAVVADCAPMFKEMQRRSASFRNCWAAYCQMHGNGMSDPNKQSKDFMVGFVEHVCGHLGAMPGIVAPAGLVPPMRASSPYNVYGKAPVARPSLATPSGPFDQATTDLVQRIKAFQRANAMQKEAWHAYADEHLGGMRDPAKHDAMTLLAFIDWHSVP